MEVELFMEFIKSRRSVRQFADKKVSREQIELLIEAACWAPSNHNRQGWKFIVFSDAHEIADFAYQTRYFIRQTLEGSHRLISGQAEELIHFSGAFDKAPILILAMHKKSPAVGKMMLKTAASKSVSGELVSTAMACQNLLLTAHCMGLGACVMTAPLIAGPVWNSVKHLPAGFELTCLVAVGYPAENPQTPRRKKLEHIMEYR